MRRSQLYVPGNNERMIAKSSTLDSDSVILDLEDAVPASEKTDARKLVCRMAGELDWGLRELCVRVNPVGSKEFMSDLAAIKQQKRIQTILVPKAERRMPGISKSSGKALIPIVETAAGFLRVGEIARSGGVVALTYGAADYAASVGGSISAYLGNETIKTTIAAVAGDHGLEAIDNVFFDLNDREGFRREATLARSLGFVGKQVIHPSQIALANEIFSPSKEEVEWAARVLEAYGKASASRIGAVAVDGKLVDAVHYRLARGIMERSRALG
jgi:citrate lyase subunit beta/citryl-CoA lyase